MPSLARRMQLDWTHGLSQRSPLVRGSLQPGSAHAPRPTLMCVGNRKRQEQYEKTPHKAGFFRIKS